VLDGCLAQGAGDLFAAYIVQPVEDDLGSAVVPNGVGSGVTVQRLQLAE